MFTSHFIRAALILTISAFTSRFIFHNFETRWQILIFWAIVVTYQLVIRPALGRSISVASTILDLVAVTVAIIAMKVLLERRIWP